METMAALGGIITGILLTELFRRYNRIESFNNQIFNERLETFNLLYQLLQDSYVEINEFLDNRSKYNDEEWNQIAHSYIFKMVQFNDVKGFFFSDELKVHTGALYMGLEDVSFEYVSEYIEGFSRTHKNTIEMVMNESGISKINKSLHGIIGYKHDSPIIRYFRQLKKKERKKK
ncbi:hypothetical protein [Petrocella sp. FN5]|uniref:hypothetical protein n=1 Tax=Petrocella sp. FN5 TaxID=3032002 RepID=UPI0023DC2C8C|nr:hypothetical protein [Petrocella sp. FN5]MDF1617304.1 hypothetical protein [Petrocella sp. FN5]